MDSSHFARRWPSPQDGCHLRLHRACRGGERRKGSQSQGNAPGFSPSPSWPELSFPPASRPRERSADPFLLLCWHLSIPPKCPAGVCVCAVGSEREWGGGSRWDLVQVPIPRFLWKRRMDLHSLTLCLVIWGASSLESHLGGLSELEEGWCLPGPSSPLLYPFPSCYGLTGAATNN